MTNPTVHIDAWLLRNSVSAFCNSKLVLILSKELHGSKYSRRVHSTLITWRLWVLFNNNIYLLPAFICLLIVTLWLYTLNLSTWPWAHLTWCCRVLFLWTHISLYPTCNGPLQLMSDHFSDLLNSQLYQPTHTVQGLLMHLLDLSLKSFDNRLTV
jgi:hypothetical protein